jgi:hypothetical protein
MVGEDLEPEKKVFRIGGNTFYDQKNKIPMKIPEFKRSRIGLSRNSAEFQTNFPTKFCKSILPLLLLQHQFLSMS